MLGAEPASAEGGHGDGAVIRLPRGDPRPPTKRETELLEATLTVLRAAGPAAGYAAALEQNIRAFRQGVQDSQKLTKDSGVGRHAREYTAGGGAVTGEEGRRRANST